MTNPQGAPRRTVFSPGLLRSPTSRLVTGCGLLVAVAGFGGFLKAYPGSTPVDRLAFRILPPEYTMTKLLYIADLGRPRVVVPGLAVCCVMAFFWDRRRAIACVIGPAVAVAITEYVAKPAVNRTYGGTLCYPSGHMTALAALVAAFVLAVPPRFRKAALVAGILVDIIMGIALMLLRWHYLTDVVAGPSVSVGVMLIVDTLLHIGVTVPSRNGSATASSQLNDAGVGANRFG